MKDCFDYCCPFRVNFSTSVSRCDCIACPNRWTDDIVLVSDHTLTDKELAYIVDSDYGVGRYA